MVWKQTMVRPEGMDSSLQGTTETTWIGREGLQEFLRRRLEDVRQTVGLLVSCHFASLGV